MGPIQNDLFGPEHTFAEVEKQWEEAAPDTDASYLGDIAIVLIVFVCIRHTIKVFNKERQ